MNKTKQSLIAKYGSEEAYRQHMQSIRLKVKNHPGGSFRDPEVAKQAARRSAEVRRAKKKGNAHE